LAGLVSSINTEVSEAPYIARPNRNDGETRVNTLIEFKQSIRSQLSDDVSVTLFWKGRVALYVILKALGIAEGDEVIVPGLTCVVVPNAVIYSGATPIYADVDPATYTLSPESVEPLITPRTRAIIAQNTFGLSANLDPILDLAKKKGIEVIDDCTHGFGGAYKGKPNGSVTRLSFFSTNGTNRSARASPWRFRSGSCPVAEEAARELVNLPTDPDMSRGEVGRVKAFVRSHAEFIF
jgi:dTDP-4-amino-4,6-dideoxygalactose transaminase